MIGAALYSEVYSFIHNNFLKLGDYGKLTIPALLGVNEWVVTLLVLIIIGGFLLWADSKKWAWRKGLLTGMIVTPLMRVAQL